MSRFFSTKYKNLIPYTPGEQPKQRKFVKLNTNESPFPPAPLGVKMAREAAANLGRYPDPECREISRIFAEKNGLLPEEVIWTNGSDDILNFAFMAFCDKNTPAAFPNISYGFYPVFAEANGIDYELIPLKEDFTIDCKDYFSLGKTIFIANPNAPTGIALSRDEIEEIIKQNSENVVVIDEAYVDFGAESSVPLVHKYDNLLVTQTFSKSRSLAGGRLGMGIASKGIIDDLNTIRFSTNPYDINSMTMAAGIGTLLQEEYTQKNCKTVAENREYTAGKLKKMGFLMTPSVANFLFVRSPKIAGKELYRKLKENGVLVRHFDTPILADYCRITVGSREEMEILLKTIELILEDV